MYYLVAAIIGLLASWTVIRGLLTGTIDPGGVQFHRADEPMSFWGVAILAGAIAIASFGVLGARLFS
jgi:hypothetical protein